MGTLLIEQIFELLLVLSIALLILVSAILAHCGKRFWGTWTMMIGSSLTFLGLLANQIGLHFHLQSFHDPDLLPSETLLQSGAITALTGLITYFIGLFGLCTRWGKTAQRAEELEALTQSLAAERDSAPSP